MSKGIWRPAIVVSVALAVRLTALASTYPDRFYFGKYLVLGRELAESGLIAQRPFSYSPIYTYLVAIGQLVTGDALLPILVVQVLLGCVSCWLLYVIARRFVDPTWALVVGLAAAIHRSFVLYDVTLLSDALGLLLQLTLLFVLLRIDSKTTWRRFVLIGVLIGLCILQRPHCLLLVPALLVGLRLGGRAWRPALIAAGLAGGVALATTMPVALQNYRLTGSLGTTASNPGYIFYSSNNYSSYGFRYSPPELYFRGAEYHERLQGDEGFLGDAEIAAMISGAVLGERTSLSESSRFYLGQSASHMLAYPGHYLALLLQRVQLAFHAFEAHDVLPVFARYENVAAWTPLRFGWFAPFGLLGLFLSLARWRRFAWIYLLLLNQLALLLGFYVVVRFRLPVEALMLFLAGYAGLRIQGWIRERDRKRLIATVIALVALVGLTHWLPGVTRDRAHGRNMEVLLEDAQRLLQRGRTDDAATRLQRLIEEDREILPRGVRARSLLQRLGGDPGVDRTPGDPRVELRTRQREGRITLQERRYLAQLEVAAGTPEAEVALAAFLEARPQDPLVRFELARVLYGLGRAGDAREELRIAIRDGLLLTTRGMHGCELLARIAEEAGDSVEARNWIAQASRLAALSPWYGDNASIRDLIGRLKTLPGYAPPPDLDALLPY